MLIEGEPTCRGCMFHRNIYIGRMVSRSNVNCIRFPKAVVKDASDTCGEHQDYREWYATNWPKIREYLAKEAEKIGDNPEILQDKEGEGDENG